MTIREHLDGQCHSKENDWKGIKNSFHEYFHKFYIFNYTAAERELILRMNSVKKLKFCKILVFYGGEYEEWHLLGCYAVWLL
jgi:hypothetical protein